jgi:hypothetical protein
LAYYEYRRKTILIQRWWKGECARQKYKQARKAVVSTQSDTLSAEWRWIIQRVSSIEALEDDQEFFRQIRNPISQIDIRVDQDALERNGSPQIASDSDRQLA